MVQILLLCNKKVFTQVRGVDSKIEDTGNGVLQGSCLGSLLFSCN